MKNWDELDWTNPKEMISEHFTIKEAIYLPSWKRMAEGDELPDDAKEALVKFFRECMDPIRDLVGEPIKVHVAHRPEAYNKLVGGAKASAHMARNDPTYGLIAACDWSADLSDGPLGEDCDACKDILRPKLEELGIRMEKNGDGATWVHNDNRAPGPSGREFPV